MNKKEKELFEEYSERDLMEQSLFNIFGWVCPDCHSLHTPYERFCECKFKEEEVEE